MDGDGEPTVPSQAMEATPALDARADRGAIPAVPGPGAPAAAAPTAGPIAAGPIAAGPIAEREPDPEQMSIARRLRQPRTIISIAVPLVIIGIFVVGYVTFLKVEES